MTHMTYRRVVDWHVRYFWMSTMSMVSAAGGSQIGTDPAAAELWKLEGPSAEEIQAAKAAAQKVPGSRRSEMIGRWLGWGYGVGQCEANWMVQDGFRCVISQDMSGYGGIAVPFNILEPAALRHNWCAHAGGRGPFPKVEGVESSIRGMQMPVSCHRVPIYIYIHIDTINLLIVMSDDVSFSKV